MYKISLLLFIADSCSGSVQYVSNQSAKFVEDRQVVNTVLFTTFGWKCVIAEENVPNL